jgi:hypothetical protein
MKTETERIVFEVVAASKSHSQKGDVAKQLQDQGFFDGKEMPKSLQNREKMPSGGNPVDVLKDFEKQNPN